MKINVVHSIGKIILSQVNFRHILNYFVFKIQK